MNDSELVEIIREIIISKQPLSSSTSEIRRKLYKHDVYLNPKTMLKFLKQWAERDPKLTGVKGGREYFWRYDGGVMYD